MKIPIINGIYTDQNADYGTLYPVNLMPIPKEVGINNGYLKPADGLSLFATLNGIDRGGIVWNNNLYRVVDDKLVAVSNTGVVTEVGIVSNDNKQVVFKYSFDRLAIATAGKLYYYNGTTLIQVTDVDLGTVLDLEWVDGYFMTTDGTYLVITELTDPIQIDPLKYGSSEADSDTIKGLAKIRNEIYALNRYTIEVFDNVGGTGFPFKRIEGALIDKGTVGTHTNCTFADTLAFMGSGRNESIAIYIGNNATASKISTREIDTLLEQYTEDELSNCLMETRIFKNQQLLYIHLKDRTLVFDSNSTQQLGVPVWFILTSSILGFSTYKAKNFIYFNNKWIFGDPTQNRLGFLDETHSNHFGDITRWEFGTTVLYNESRGAIINEMELVCLAGRTEFGKDPTIYTSYSLDGLNWSVPRFIKAGKQGQYLKRLVWRQLGMMSNFRFQKFTGTSDAFINITRLEAQLEQLNV